MSSSNSKRAEKNGKIAAEFSKNGFILLWKIAQIKATTDQPDEQRPLSLRKALKKGNFPSIITDNPAMEKLPLGR